jgi:hypothetical protein
MESEVHHRAPVRACEPSIPCAEGGAQATWFRRESQLPPKPPQRSPPGDGILPPVVPRFRPTHETMDSFEKAVEANDPSIAG